MRVSIAKIEQQPYPVDTSLEPAARGVSYDEFAVAPQVSVSARLVRAGGAKFRLEGRLQADPQAICVRCLEPFPVHLERSFLVSIVPVAGHDPEAADEFPYEGEVIELEPVLLEQFHLAIPMRFVCDESCKGLCPSCGTNLNQRVCGCEPETGDPRFAVLKSLLN